MVDPPDPVEEWENIFDLKFSTASQLPGGLESCDASEDLNPKVFKYQKSLMNI